VAVRMALLYLLVGGERERQELSMNLLIKNARVMDPASGTDARLDVLIEGGKIAEMGPGIPEVKVGRGFPGAGPRMPGNPRER